jgi:hypothetical protein
MLTVPGFFDQACDMLAAGDMVMMSASDGGRLAFVAAATDRVTLAAMM